MVGLELDQSKGGDTGEDEVSGTLAVRKDEPPPSLSTPLCPLQGGTEAQMATSLAEGGCNSGLSVLSVADLAEELCPCTGLGRTPHPTPILAGAAGAGVASALSAGGGGGTLWPVMRATAGRGRRRPTFAPSVEKKTCPSRARPLSLPVHSCHMPTRQTPN